MLLETFDLLRGMDGRSGDLSVGSIVASIGSTIISTAKVSTASTIVGSSITSIVTEIGISMLSVAVIGVSAGSSSRLSAGLTTSSVLTIASVLASSSTSALDSADSSVGLSSTGNGAWLAVRAAPGANLLRVEAARFLRFTTIAQLHPPNVINLKLKPDACSQPCTQRKIEFIEPLLLKLNNLPQMMKHSQEIMFS